MWWPGFVRANTHAYLGQVEVHTHVLGDVLSDEQEKDCRGRLSETALFRIFGLRLPPAPASTWQYVCLVNRGSVLSLLHIDGLRSCNDDTPTSDIPVEGDLGAAVHRP